LQAQLLAQGDTAELRSGGSSALPQPARVCVDFPNGTTQIGDAVRVSVSFTYHWLPILDAATKLIDNKKGFNATATTFTATSIMRIEVPPTTYGAGCV
jgi:hypothetical protein